MKKTILIIAGSILLSATPKKYSVVIELTHTSSYCGGAAPSDELINELNTPVPYANKKLYLKKGSVNTLESKMIKEVVSDSLGRIRLSLIPGKYFLVEEEKKDRKYYDYVMKTYAEQTKEEGPVDKECFDKWFATPELIITAGSKGSSVSKLNIHHECKWSGKPCIPYFGPVPP